MKDLEGKVAFVTGASTGIGYALAEAFGKSGMRLMLAGINEARLDAAVERLSQQGIAAERVQCDVGSRASVQHAAEATIAKFGKVHVVCNNAGVAANGAIGSIPESDWDWVIRVNLMGVVHGTEIFAPLIEQHGEGGHILNTASVAGMMSSPTMEPYSATKFAVVAMSEGWRAQLADKGIGVSVLCPGFVRTEIASAERNRPDGPRQGGDSERNAVMQGLLDAGMDPAMLAERVLEGMRDNELYIFTHPELKPLFEARFTDILDSVDRAAKSPTLENYTPQDLSALGLPGLDAP